MIGIRGGAPRRARLVGFGSCLPETVITNQDLEHRVDCVVAEWAGGRRIGGRAGGRRRGAERAAGAAGVAAGAAVVVDGLAEVLD